MPVGGAAIDSVGVPLPEETLAAAKESDAVLLGAIGGSVLLCFHLLIGLFTDQWPSLNCFLFPFFPFVSILGMV